MKEGQTEKFATIVAKQYRFTIERPKVCTWQLLEIKRHKSERRCAAIPNQNGPNAPAIRRWRSSIATSLISASDRRFQLNLTAGSPSSSHIGKASSQPVSHRASTFIQNQASQPANDNSSHRLFAPRDESGKIWKSGQTRSSHQNKTE